MLNTALLSRMSQKSQHTRYEEIILGRTCCEEAPQFVPACYSVLFEDVTSPKSYLLGTRIGTIRQIAQVVVKKMTQSLALCRPSQIEHVGQCGF